jgi:hypothetical protein
MAAASVLATVSTSPSPGFEICRYIAVKVLLASYKHG